jgi:hypothetical protein
MFLSVGTLLACGQDTNALSGTLSSNSISLGDTWHNAYGLNWRIFSCRNSTDCSIPPLSFVLRIHKDTGTAIALLDVDQLSCLSEFSLKADDAKF